MNAAEAHDLNRLLRWLTGTANPAEPISAEAARQAAETLAERAASTLTAGISPAEIRQHWPAAHDQGEDGPACVVCGCTENAPCEGGCWWVPDPLLVADVCNRCAPGRAAGTTPDRPQQAGENPIHADPYEGAGKTYALDAKGIEGDQIRVEDWWDRVHGQPWGESRADPAAFDYALRSAVIAALPIDDEVLYGEVGGIACVVHVSELGAVLAQPGDGSLDATPAGEQ